MSQSLPPGFKFHHGLDGLLVGLSLVFLVRVHMAISQLVDWRLVPEWSYRPLVDGMAGLGRGIQSTIRSLTAPFTVAGSGSAAGSTGGAEAAQTGAIDLSILVEFGKLVGSPVLIVGGLDAPLLDQLLIVFGFWIAVLVPLWFWGIRPFLFWWRSSGIL